MLYRSHLVTSACIAIPVLQATNELNYLTLAGVCLGALLPDIDEPKSFIGEKIPIIPSIVKSIFGHRGITHSLLAVGGVFFIALIMRKPIFFGMFLGYFLHLLEDNFSVSGIKWLTPFSNKSYKIPVSFFTYKTGGLKEHLIFFIVSVILFLEVYHMNFYNFNIKHMLRIFHL